MTRSAPQPTAPLRQPPVSPLPPASVRWSPAERARLQAGAPACRAASDLSHGLAAVRVCADADRVWRAILDFDAYRRFLPYVTGSFTDAAVDGTPSVHDARFELTTKGVVTRYRVRCFFYEARHWMPFVLLPEDGGALRHASGSWQVLPHDDGVLLVYRLQATVSWWVPRFARRLAAHRGLPLLAERIARRAEADPR